MERLVSAQRARPAGRSRWRLWERFARPTVMGVALAFTISNLYFMASADWFAWDIEAYWGAADRLRQGQPLYIPYEDVGAPDVYRYAPWFAWLWVPLTYLPRDIVSVAWCLAMLALSCLAVWPAIRSRTEAGVALALLCWPAMAYVSVGGNVHAAMVAGLVFALNTRWGPLAIAAAASLKAVPLALALVYLGRRQYGQFIVTLGLTAALVAPMLLYGLGDYTTDPGGAVLLTGLPYYAAVAAGAVATILTARSRYGWLAGATTVVIAFPRWFIYDVPLILAGYPARGDQAPNSKRA